MDKQTNCLVHINVYTTTTTITVITIKCLYGYCHYDYCHHHHHDHRHEIIMMAVLYVYLCLWKSEMKNNYCLFHFFRQQQPKGHDDDYDHITQQECSYQWSFYDEVEPAAASIHPIKPSSRAICHFSTKSFSLSLAFSREEIKTDSIIPSTHIHSWWHHHICQHPPSHKKIEV